MRRWARSGGAKSGFCEVKHAATLPKHPVPLGLLAAFWTYGAVAPAAQLETRSQLWTDLVPFSVVTADFNHDGNVDIAVSSLGTENTFPAAIQIYLGHGDGTFDLPIPYDVGFLAGGPLAAGDFRHDGNTDLVVPNYSGFVSVLLGNGDGTFQPPVNYATPPRPTQVVIGDFNGDGKLDIAVAGQGNGEGVAPAVGILFGNGDGTFQEPAITTSLPSGPNAMTSGYFGAGALDLALTLGFESSDTVQILVGNGDGTFTLGTSYQLAALNSDSMIAADFRNNGKTDLAVAELEGRGIAVLLGKGDYEFEQPVTYYIPGALAVAAADMNGDGVLDLVATTSYGINLVGEVGILLGRGDGTFGEGTLFLSGEFPRAMAVADFNGDGKPDVTASDQASSVENVLLNTGVVSFSPTTRLYFKSKGSARPARRKRSLSPIPAWLS